MTSLPSVSPNLGMPKGTFSSGRFALVIVQVVLAALLAINVALTSWMLSTAMDTRERLVKIESNRFTSADGLGVWKEIAGIRQQIAELPTRLEIKNDVSEINNRLRIVERNHNGS